ncbi:8704_t:CDS:2 [Paraglomus occultum]|uniref:8704_t:CDS:1 n=1 Tax=Paraglomus occultum TaxID=144539 RepID=A0A9N9BFL1_9GLOM|nr:8704_t:CDS:2 [Paraglomus occultum]
MHLTSLSALFTTILFAFLSLSEAALPGTWPLLDKPPPMKPEWASLVNIQQLPKAPIQTTLAGNCSQAAQFCIWSCNTCTRSASDIVTCPGTKEWGISYDDGPSPYTPALLDFLKQTNTKVTFAVIGSRVVERPEVLQRIKDEGHEIVIHTWSHPSLTTVSTQQIIAELKWTELAIQTAVGLTPKIMRPPFGDIDDRVRSIATQLGYKILLWDRDTFDWKSASDPSFQPSWIPGNFTQWVTDGNSHISLEHDLYPIGAQNAPAAIKIVRNAGYTIKPVSVCTGMPAYVQNVQLVASGPAPPNTTANGTDGTANTASTNDTSNNSSSSSAFGSHHLLSSVLLLIVISMAISTL